jgi:hypothetical protein
MIMSFIVYFGGFKMPTGLRLVFSCWFVLVLAIAADAASKVKTGKWEYIGSGQSDSTYGSGWADTVYTETYSDYPQEIQKSLENLKSESERAAIRQILDELDNKLPRELLRLRLAVEVCQEIACRGVSSDTVHRYVEAYTDMRRAEDLHQTGLRNAAASERSSYISAGATIISLFSFFVAVLGYRRKSAERPVQ